MPTIYFGYMSEKIDVKSDSLIKMVFYFVNTATTTYSLHSISCVTDEDVMLTHTTWELGDDELIPIIITTVLVRRARRPAIFIKCIVCLTL